MKNDEGRLPEVFSATEIALWHVSEQYQPGKWRPARCCGIFGLRLRERFKIAWRVFTGRYDALNWGDHSGTWSNDEVEYKDITENGFKRAGKTDL